MSLNHLLKFPGHRSRIPLAGADHPLDYPISEEGFLGKDLLVKSIHDGFSSSIRQCSFSMN